MKLTNLLSILLLGASGAVLADASVPNKDLAGAQDSPLLKRYEGSFIVEYNSKAYDEISLPLSTLLQVGEDVHDRHNNFVYAAKTKLDLEGKLTRMAYVLPEGRSPLEVLRNYQDVVKAAGAAQLWECKTESCGGDIETGSSHGGGRTGVLEGLFPPEAIKSTDFTNGNCAINMAHVDQRFFVAKLGETHVAVMTYTAKDDLYCKAINDRTVAIVVLLEAKPREQKMVTVKASEMSQTITQTGKVALYGILFDFNKSDVKPESKAQLDEIASLLKGNAALKLLIVGHTDNQGGMAYNLDLSKKRADAVVAALTQQYAIAGDRLAAQGMGSAAPVASNDNDEGRAKNRRVELVKQ